MTTRKNALVTGAGGFIGGHLVRHLLEQDGYDVMAVDRKPRRQWWQYHQDAYNVTNTHVRELKKIDSKVDEVYHLAADMGGIGYITRNLTSCAANIVDTIHLLEHCHPEQRVFFASSACVYPQNLQSDDFTIPLREDDVYPADPEPGYGWEKLYGEQVMRWHREERSIKTRVARYHNVAGPYGSWTGGREKAPAAICRKIAIAELTGLHQIEIWGDGEQVRTFMPIDDCITGTLMIARGNCVDPLNLGSDFPVTINQLVDIIEEIAGIKVQRTYNLDAPQGVRGRISDNTLIRQVYNWAPQIELVDWLEPLYRWIREQVFKEE